jgi:hypothetical protein
MKKSIEKQNWRNEKDKDLLVAYCNNDNAVGQNNHVCRFCDLLSQYFPQLDPKIKCRYYLTNKLH